MPPAPVFSSRMVTVAVPDRIWMRTYTVSPGAVSRLIRCSFGRCGTIRHHRYGPK